MVFYIINLGLQFFSRKIFLEYLGTEILGLNTAALNLLQFLNLAELGVSSAVGFSLYKPLHENDKTTINEIVTLQGHLYRRIAYLIMIGAAILMCFFPLIFDKISVPIWYAYGSFGVLLFSALLGYFFNYRQIVLSANQQDYKILYSYKSVMLVKVIAQMLAVRYLHNGYTWWLICEAMFAVIATATLTWMTKQSIPYLANTRQSFSELNNKYKELTTKIKQLFFHKVAGFALTQSSPIIIYAYTSLTIVALYGNYMIIINGINVLIASFFNGLSAGIGNLIAEAKIEKIYSVFEELFSIRFAIVTSVCFTAYYQVQSFIRVWIGSEYLLTSSTVVLLICLLYVSLSRYSVDSFISGFGLYKDIYAPIIEALVNIILSILLGYKWGLDGILLGVLISQIIIVKIWKPYFLFKNGLLGYLKKYIILVLKHFLCLALSTMGTLLILPVIQFSVRNEIITLLINLLLSFSIFLSFIFLTLIIFKTGIIKFFRRIKTMYIN